MTDRDAHGALLPPPLMNLLVGDHLEEHDAEAFCLSSVDDDGWPHLALLSVGEVLATSPRELRLALWRNSTTSANLETGGQALFVAVADGAAWHIRGGAQPLGVISVEGEDLAAFRFDVDEVVEDRVGYADTLGGVRYRLRDPEKAHRRWRATIAALREF